MKFNIKKIFVDGMPDERAKVKTEKAFLSSLYDHYSDNEKYTIIDFLWVESIISFGLENTQKIIDSLYEGFNNSFSKVCFINQHISAENLDWKDGIVFSCHANKKNDFISIPHFPNVSSLHDEKRDIFFSFMGSFETHYTRKLFDNLSCNKKYYIKDTGGWHYYNRKIENEERYRELLSRSIYTLCPRGTGHGTIRLFESLNSGSIPIIISDDYKLPIGLVNNHNCIVIPESKTTSIPRILDENAFNVEKMQINIKEYANTYLKKDKLSTSIIKSMENL
jgi:hypothetical protein